MCKIKSNYFVKINLICNNFLIEFLFLVIGLIFIIIQVLKDRKEYKEHLMNRKTNLFFYSFNNVNNLFFK